MNSQTAKGAQSFSGPNSSNSMASALVRDVGSRGPSTVFGELAWVTDTNAPETAMTTTVTRIMQVGGVQRGQANIGRPGAWLRPAASKPGPPIGHVQPCFPDPLCRLVHVPRQCCINAARVQACKICCVCLPCRSPRMTGTSWSGSSPARRAV